MLKIDWKGRHPNSYTERERRAIILPVLKTLVGERKGHFDESEYQSTKVTIEITCENGHSWKIKPQEILKGSWCRICFNKYQAGQHLVKDRIADAKRIAEERGGTCLSNEWFNANVKLSWRCANNHTWEAHFGDIKKGTWSALYENTLSGWILTF